MQTKLNLPIKLLRNKLDLRNIVNHIHVNYQFHALLYLYNLHVQKIYFNIKKKRINYKKQKELYSFSVYAKPNDGEREKMGFVTTKEWHWTVRGSHYIASADTRNDIKEFVDSVT